VLIRFNLNADELKRACEHMDVISALVSDDVVEFNVVMDGVWVTSLGKWQLLSADVQSEGRVAIPAAVVEGLIQTLPYFGKKKVEIGCSEGRLRIHTTVFHSREIVVSGIQSDPQRGSRWRRRVLSPEVA
jgi:hypothetical protein